MYNAFETLPIPRKDSAASQTGSYRVYKSGTEYVTVSAPTALEALKNCGLEQVYKIERDTLSSSNVLDPAASTKALLGEQQPQNAPPAASQETVAPAQAPAA